MSQKQMHKEKIKGENVLRVTLLETFANRKKSAPPIRTITSHIGAIAPIEGIQKIIERGTLEVITNLIQCNFLRID
jgi:hypothetical protein